MPPNRSWRKVNLTRFGGQVVKILGPTDSLTALYLIS
jgi:hypothetical protein